jgi:hypothetical protein
MQPLADVSSPVVHLSFEAPRPQRRWTVGLRWILAFPHLLWLAVLGLVGFFALLVGWVCALFTGRLPTGIREFLAKIARYATRVMAYGSYLLTDTYPSFSLESDGYPVELELPEPVRLNRAAVLFRFILLVPGGFVVSLVSAGTWPILIVAWLIAVLTGRLPRPVYEAFTAILRYQGRYYAFAGMLTSEQPKKLLGDGPPPAVEAALPDDQAPVPAAVPAAAPTAPAVGGPRITRLTLSKGGRRIVVLAIVLGAAFNVATNARTAIMSSQANEARDAFYEADREAFVAYQEWQAEGQRCITAAEPDCLRLAYEDLAEAYATYRSDLDEISWPQQAQVAARDLDTTLSNLEAQARVLAAVVGTPSQDAEFATFLDLMTDLNEHVSELDLALAPFG